MTEDCQAYLTLVAHLCVHGALHTWDTMDTSDDVWDRIEHHFVRVDYDDLYLRGEEPRGLS